MPGPTPEAQRERIASCVRPPVSTVDLTPITGAADYETIAQSPSAVSKLRPLAPRPAMLHTSSRHPEAYTTTPKLVLSDAFIAP